MMYFERGNVSDRLRSDDLKQGLYTALDKLGEKKKVLVVPPDITRFHSHAGELTEMAWKYYGNRLTDILPANLLQAQRDYFGAHTYERVDKPRGKFYHTNWTGRDGTTPASTYIV